ncbi:MAG: hypothetical protein LOD92_09840 [Bacillales bacterium]
MAIAVSKCVFPEPGCPNSAMLFCLVFLIWSKEGAPTNKVRKALSINEKKKEKNISQGLPEDSGLIQIMTGAEFEEYLSQL